MPTSTSSRVKVLLVRSAKVFSNWYFDSLVLSSLSTAPGRSKGTLPPRAPAEAMEDSSELSKRLCLLLLEGEAVVLPRFCLYSATLWRGTLTEAVLFGFFFSFSLKGSWFLLKVLSFLTMFDFSFLCSI